MPNDLTRILWLLKLGALANLYFLVDTLNLVGRAHDPHITAPALILFAVSGYRCLFPNRYKDNVVLHSTVLSSTLVTRTLATFAEVAWIYQFSNVIRLLNIDEVAWVTAASWIMVLQVLASQFFVWASILTRREVLFVYEEAGWAIIFAANTLASAYLYTTTGPTAAGETLLALNLLFGLIYLPWQWIHLRTLRSDARQSASLVEPVTLDSLRDSLGRSLRERNPATDAASWGGLVGVTWMTAYWAAVIPVWVHQVVRLSAAV